MDSDAAPPPAGSPHDQADVRFDAAPADEDPRRQPRLTLVVAAYNVEPYLRQCFDSILGQRFGDIEVIAVDDASTDGSRRIVEDYARADRRVTPVLLDENRGLGNARNVGLDRARGEYTMFVDGDDWLAGDCLEAIVRRLDETSPDLLCFNFVRSYWDGRTLRNVNERILRARGPAVFTLRDRPDVIRLLMVAWNKAYRTAFLRQLGQRFTAGYYEDVPVTYPALMAADRISVLDRVCYHYRQRRTGAITRTPGRRHFEVFDKYEHVFAFMDARPEFDVFRAAMFERMIWHYLVILARTGTRIRPEDRRDFFRYAAAHYARYEPSGFVPPPSLDERVKHRLLARDAYALFQTFKHINSLRLRLGGWVLRWWQRARSSAKRSIDSVRLARY